ncbi:MAG: DRTGG domain-containing protein [Tissierellia bacterium]|jgi:predicted transcriptional regulator|nr:DRTGG domain-containing protein [Tissierellia bacterium]MDD3226476.1 DRTGG domain-containing protein [Tissierellia bacterium]MDD3750756.1 DRTGG domain-containing protein [Tissierellia bacterium]MDD4046268.1 DRTGG domain-containing protein [Tissierellia bacterium]MDD4678121.1 DRTGG domain-containing protein [Tissierellia bacterium]
MIIKEIVDIVKADVLTNYNDGNTELKYGFASDLMSDVLAYARSDSLLITGLNNPQVIRTVEMLDINAVLFVRGKVPCSEVIELAKENCITILATEYTMFKTCGLLVMNGMKGLEIDD